MCFVLAIASEVWDILGTSWAAEHSAASCISLIVFNTPKFSRLASWPLLSSFMTRLSFDIVLLLVLYFAFVVLLLIVYSLLPATRPLPRSSRSGRCSGGIISSGGTSRKASAVTGFKWRE